VHEQAECQYTSYSEHESYELETILEQQRAYGFISDSGQNFSIFAESSKDSFRFAANAKGSHQLSDLQELKVCSRFKESDGEEEQKGSDQNFSFYFPPTKIKQSTFSIDFCEGKEEKQFSSQLGQQGRHLSTNREPVMEGQFFFINQNVSDLDFRDPVGDLIELYISDPLQVLDLIHSSISVGEYDFLICFSYFLLSSDRDKVITVLKLLRWLL